MKTKWRGMPEREYEALCDKIYGEVDSVVGGGTMGTSVWFVTGDFEPTHNPAEARWIMTDGGYDRLLFQIDQAGDAILLEPTLENY